MNTFWRKLMFQPMLEKEGAGGAGGNDPGKDPANDPGNDPITSTKGTEKTFTQEELNRIAAQEKRQGMSSVLKALGFEKEDDAKAFVEKYREIENNKKDDLTRVQENLELEKKAKEEAEKKADWVEKKFKVMSLGVKADKVDDLVILATAKAVEGKTFDDALEDLKKSYPALFEEESAGGTGTGGTPPRSRTGAKSDGGIGKRLAEQKRKSAQEQKKSYFSN